LIVTWVLAVSIQICEQLQPDLYPLMLNDDDSVSVTVCPAAAATDDFSTVHVLISSFEQNA
jgi:hypothetical protein